MRHFRFFVAALLLLTLAVIPASAQSRDEYDPAGAVGGATGTLSSQPWQPSEAVLYDNGPFETTAGESLLENVTLGLTTLGAGAQFTVGNSVADDFTVAGNGWTVDQITGFTYQSFSPNVSTVTQVHVRIYDGDPSGAPTVVFDGFGGCLATTTETNVFRYAESAGFNMDRAIFTAPCTVGMDLPAGTYWVEFAFSGTGASGPWAPPVTILGTSPVPGANSQQNTGAWAPLTDGGTGDALAIPFIVEGDPISVFTPVQPIPTLGQWGMIAFTLLLIALGIYTLSRRRRQTA